MDTVALAAKAIAATAIAPPTLRWSSQFVDDEQTAATVIM
jgi:hypothetical protein